MNRRDFLWAGAGVCGAAAARRVLGQPGALRVQVEEDKLLGAIPEDFTGLGYEVSTVARVGELSPANKVYRNLVRGLSAKGVLRVGGNTSDYASYATTGAAAAKPKGAVVNRASVEELAGFCRATGWRLIWGLNLGEGSAAEAVDEAQAVTDAAGGSLLAFEIGNEPDLFVGEGHRKAGYKAEDYLAEYESTRRRSGGGCRRRRLQGRTRRWERSSCGGSPRRKATT